MDTKTQNRLIIGLVLLCNSAVVWGATNEPVTPPYSWRGINGSGVFSVQDVVTEFWDVAADTVTKVEGARPLDIPVKPGEKKNVVWRTTLPFWGQSTPVVVRDRVFVTCDGGWKSDALQLVCVDVNNGKILWQRDVDHMDAWPEKDGAVGKAARAKDRELWRQYMQAWNRTFWDNERNGFRRLTSSQFEQLVGQARADGFDLSQQAVMEREEVNGKEFVSLQGGYKTWRARCYWGYAVPEKEAEFKKLSQDVIRKRYNVRPSWTAEGPYYDCTFPSPVSDGQSVYVVCPPDAVASFDLDGNRRWVADLAVGGRPGHYAYYHTDMASPVLAGDKLVYWSAGGVAVFGLDKATGKLAWKLPAPRTDVQHKDWPNGGVPRGTEGHMGHGGTPVVMRLGNTLVVVAGSGLVVRVSDGVLLGQVNVPQGAPIGKGREVEIAEEDYYGSSYLSWTAHDDVLFYQPGAGLYAVRLGLNGSELTQTILWRLNAMVDGRNPNLVYRDKRVYAKANRPSGGAAVVGIDAATGNIVASGPSSSGHDTNLGFGRDVAVWPTGHIGDQTEGKSDPAQKPGHGLTRYTVVSLPDLKPVGRGYLCAEAPTGEVAERHIAVIGTARVVWGNAGISLWGNRIFVRNNDYLWCIGDPAQPWTPSENNK